MQYAQLPESLRTNVDEVLAQFKDVLKAHNVDEHTRDLSVALLRYALGALVLEAFCLGHELCEVSFIEQYKDIVYTSHEGHGCSEDSAKQNNTNSPDKRRAH